MSVDLDKKTIDLTSLKVRLIDLYTIIREKIITSYEKSLKSTESK